MKVRAASPKSAKENTNPSNTRRSRSKPAVEEVVVKVKKLDKTVDKSKTPEKKVKSMKNG